MTTRNLNKTRTKILLEAYTSDLSSGSEHPIRYLLFDRKFTQDLFYEIAQQVDIDTLKTAIVTYIRERGSEPSYQNDVLKVYPRSGPSNPSDD